MPEWSAADRSWMSRALMLAERGLYTTEPNPRVGCVLVVDGEVVGEGWHVRAGEGHAEVNALAQAGERARGATAYVTLEPCSHFGKTPPCADALIKAGVARMVAACSGCVRRVSRSSAGCWKIRRGRSTPVLSSACSRACPGYASSWR